MIKVGSALVLVLVGSAVLFGCAEDASVDSGEEAVESVDEAVVSSTTHPLNQSTAEGKAIMATVKDALKQPGNPLVKVTVGATAIQNGWAWINVTPTFQNPGNGEDHFLLQYTYAEKRWTVVLDTQGSEVQGSDLRQAWRKFPVPAGIVRSTQGG